MKMLAQIKQLIKNRLGLILQLVEAKETIESIEREIALLTLDVLQLQNSRKALTTYGCNCFKKIAYALEETTHNQLSEEALDLMNEGLLFDEYGAKYGADLDLISGLATQILLRETSRKKASITKRRSSLLKV